MVEMESVDDTFYGTELDGHVYKFNWILDPRLPQNDEPVNFRKFFKAMLEGGEIFLNDISMSKECRIDWQLTCKSNFKKNGAIGFSVGLKRLDSVNCTVSIFFSANIHFYTPGHKIKRSDYFENQFNKIHEAHFSQEMILNPHPDMKSFVPQLGTSSGDQHSETLHFKFWISGMIIAQNCCKTGIEKYETINRNLTQMQQDFKSIFVSKQFSDVSLNVKNENLSVHKLVLMARSPVFQKMFAQDIWTNNKNVYRVDDIEKPVMEAFLSFLYTGVLESSEFDIIFALYSVAEKYEVHTLLKTCRDMLAYRMTARTVTSVLKLANTHNDEDLNDIAVNYICNNFPTVETASEWRELMDTHPRLASSTLRKISANIYFQNLNR